MMVSLMFSRFSSMGFLSSLKTVGVMGWFSNFGLGLFAGTFPKFCMIASANSVVFNERLRTYRQNHLYVIPALKYTAKSFQLLMHFPSIQRVAVSAKPLNKRAVGLAIFFPVISGAVP